MNNSEIEKRLSQLKRQLAKKEKKLHKYDRQTKRKAHVQQKIKEHNQQFTNIDTTSASIATTPPTQPPTTEEDTSSLPVRKIVTVTFSLVGDPPSCSDESEIPNKIQEKPPAVVRNTDNDCIQESLIPNIDHEYVDAQNAGGVSESRILKDLVGFSTGDPKKSAPGPHKELYGTGLDMSEEDSQQMPKRRMQKKRLSLPARPVHTSQGSSVSSTHLSESGGQNKDVIVKQAHAGQLPCEGDKIPQLIEQDVVKTCQSRVLTSCNGQNNIEHNEEGSSFKIRSLTADVGGNDKASEASSNKHSEVQTSKETEFLIVCQQPQTGTPVVKSVMPVRTGKKRQSDSEVVNYSYLDDAVGDMYSQVKNRPRRRSSQRSEFSQEICHSQQLLESPKFLPWKRSSRQKRRDSHHSISSPSEHASLPQIPAAINVSDSQDIEQKSSENTPESQLFPSLSTWVRDTVVQSIVDFSLPEDEFSQLQQDKLSVGSQLTESNKSRYSPHIASPLSGPTSHQDTRGSMRSAASIRKPLRSLSRASRHRTTSHSKDNTSQASNESIDLVNSDTASTAPSCEKSSPSFVENGFGASHTPCGKPPPPVAVDTPSVTLSARDKTSNVVNRPTVPVALSDHLKSSLTYCHMSLKECVSIDCIQRASYSVLALATKTVVSLWVVFTDSAQQIYEYVHNGRFCQIEILSICFAPWTSEGQVHLCLTTNKADTRRVSVMTFLVEQCQSDLIRNKLKVTDFQEVTVAIVNKVQDSFTFIVLPLVAGHSHYVLVSSPDMHQFTDIARYHRLCDTDVTFSRYLLPSCKAAILSLVEIEGQPGAMLAVSRRAVYVWNYVEGLLLVSIVLAEPVLLCPRAVTSSGYIFATVTTDDEDDSTRPGQCLLAIEPVGGKYIVICSDN